MSVDTGDCGVAAYMDLYDVMGASWDQVGLAQRAAGEPYRSAAPGQVIDLRARTAPAT